MMNLDPVRLTPIKKSGQTFSISSKSISIFQTRQVINDLQNTVALEKSLDNSMLLVSNRQVTSGMIIDVNCFDEQSKIKHQLIAKDGEKDQKIVYSFLVLKQQDDQPSQVAYRWIKRIPQTVGKTSLIYVLEEQHLYRGGMRDKRKHGQGEYIIIKKHSNATQTQIRYVGRWNADIFCRGTVQDENGNIKEHNNHIFTTAKSKKNINNKLQKNATIKMIVDEMGKKKSAKQRASNASSASILEKLNNKYENSMHTIML